MNLISKNGSKVQLLFKYFIQKAYYMDFYVKMIQFDIQTVYILMLTENKKLKRRRSSFDLTLQPVMSFNILSSVIQLSLIDGNKIIISSNRHVLLDACRNILDFGLKNRIILLITGHFCFFSIDMYEKPDFLNK